MKKKRPLRRAILGTLALSALVAPPVASGCAAGFAPISQVDALRVFGVVADKPYAQPGDTVNFTLSYEDGRDPAHPRPVQILWLGGCFNPPGGEYYGCYPVLLGGSAGADAGVPAKCQGKLIPGSGTSFSLKLPDTLLDPECAPPTPGAPTYASAFVFFAVCAGTVGFPDGGAPTASAGGGLAGSFPLQCLDASGNPLGPDSFVPGYTQVYAFAPIDGQPVTNTNPTVNGLSVTLSGVADAGAVDGGIIGDGGAVAACDVSQASRQASGCSKQDPSQSCAQYDVVVDVPDDVAEIDPTTRDMNGNPLHETVWVDYYADQGDIDTPVLLVSDAQNGIQPRDKLTTKWTPPAPATSPDGGAAPLTATLWAVVHDSRAGETVVSRTITVE